MATEPMPTAAPVAEHQAQISPSGRIVGTFFSPKPTFEDIVRKPTWLLPMAIIVISALIGVVSLNAHFDWKSYVLQQIEKSPQAASLSAEQKQQRAEVGAKYSPLFAYVFGIPAPILSLLVIALVLMGAYNLFAGAGVNYKTSLSIVCHAFVPAAIVGTLLFVTVLFLKPVGSFDLENPVATNLAILFPEDASKWLLALGKNIDLLEIWKLLLLGIGFAAVNPKKLKGAKPFTIIFGIFLLYLVVRVGITFIFS
jgi:hypothetical protein